MTTWAPRFPRVLSALAASLTLVPLVTGAADQPPEGFLEHPEVVPATIECDEGPGTVSVVGQVFPTLSRTGGGQADLPLNVAASLPGDGAEADGSAQTDGDADAGSEAIELELSLVPHQDTVQNVTADEMAAASDRAGRLTTELTGESGHLVSGDDDPLLTWDDWDPPLGIYEVHVETGAFTLSGPGDCEVVSPGPVSSIQVGSEDEWSEAASEAASADESGLAAYLPWAVAVMGVLGALCLAVPAVLYLRKGRSAAE
ncbi:hypothetical protein [Nocardiopsis nanhaiensis]